MSVVHSRFFIPAVLFLLGAASFRFDDDGVVWLWSGRAVIGVVLLTCSAVMWVLLVRGLRRGSNSKESDRERTDS